MPILRNGVRLTLAARKQQPKHSMTDIVQALAVRNVMMVFYQEPKRKRALE